MKTIRIATRKSQLALYQAEWVKYKLEEAGLTAELVPIETKGDKQLDTAISKIGSKGVFTEELEEMLKNGEVDIAVHSAKDLSSELPEGFDIISIGEREEASDVVVSLKEINLNEPMTLGTSSTRRIAQLGCHYPEVETITVRGNLQTRLKKLEEGVCDGLLLAKAGVLRMEQEKLIKHEFPLDQFVPAAGQGSIAIEAYETIHPTIRKLIKAATNDYESEQEVRTERSFLKSFGGGCSVPVFAHAKKEETEITLRAGILSLDGKKHLEVESKGDNPEAIGEEAAEHLIENGGHKILNQIKEQLDYL